MRTLHKYPLQELNDRVTVLMPEGAQVRCIQMQHGMPCLWAEVDTVRPLLPRTFEVFGTGHSMSEQTRCYIGTFQLHGGDLVFHVYEATP